MTKLTARVAIKTLGEHFLAFLAANNLQGFVKDNDQEITDSTIGGALMLLAMKPEHTGLEMKEAAKHLEKISGGVLSHHRARVLVQLAVGVKYSHCCPKWPDDKVFVTDWERGIENTKVFRARHEGDQVREKTRAAALYIALMRKITQGEIRALKDLNFPETTTVSELFGKILEQRYMTQGTLKKAVYQMRVIEGKELRVHACYEQLANLLGYPEYHHIRIVMRQDIIANLKHPENRQSLITEMSFEDEEQSNVQ